MEDLPPIPWQDVPRRAMSALWAFLREVATATVRCTSILPAESMSCSIVCGGLPL